MFRKRNLILESLRRFDHSNTLWSRRVSTSVQLSWGASSSSSQSILTKNLETALKSHRVNDAWEVFKDFKRLYGFPDREIMNRFVTVLSYSSDSTWLCKASDLTRLALKENSGMIISVDVLTKLSLSLARAQLVEPACNILRTMLERGYDVLGCSDVLKLVVMHMVKTEVGTCLASNFLVQVCDRLSNGVKKKKPDTVLFNLVLSSCVRFGFSLKGQELIELMAKVDVVADAYSIVIISYVYELNGMRDELKKLKECVIGQVPDQLLCHYQRFFDNCLSLEFKFDDIASAGKLVLDICKSKDLISAGFDSRVLSLGSEHIKSGLKIRISPNLLQRGSSLGLDTESTFVDYTDSKLCITNKTLAKLVYGYKRHDKLHELSKLLFSLGGSRLCADVIDACVDISWLETAHDILDDMDSSGHTMDLATYRKVLSGYYSNKMLRNAEVLLKQMTKAGLIITTDEITVLCKNTELKDLLVRETKQLEVSSTIHELNSSLYYFCKAKMQGDAITTYREIQKSKTIFSPNLQTFWIVIDMYSSLGMYREITIVWGDIKRKVLMNSLTQDLLEKLVVSFIRGGYFERVMEVIGYMNENGMYSDVIMYKDEYLKVHKNLYRTLKASDAVSEAQAQRLEHVKAFRKLVGII